jgi:hypothetical protein
LCFYFNSFFYLVFSATTNIIFVYPQGYECHRLGTTALGYRLSRNKCSLKTGGSLIQASFCLDPLSLSCLSTDILSWLRPSSFCMGFIIRQVLGGTAPHSGARSSFHHLPIWLASTQSCT